MKSILPDIRARLVERFVFNFRIPPAVLAAHLPPWLEPQVFGGSAVASFCILDLAGVTFGPIPASLGLRNLNCGHRFAVLEADTKEPRVFVDERNTSSRLGAFITSLGFPGRHGLVDAGIEHRDDATSLRVTDSRGAPLFAATARRGATFASELFPSLDAFSEFMARGVTSYCPAVKSGTLNVVDLHKDDSVYEPLAVDEVEDRLIAEWLGSPPSLPFDSAVRTAGGTYVWEYRGQVARER